MNRTLRNGVAVAGMAGGIFFLGQAVASATDQSNSAPVNQSQGAPGHNDADVSQSNNASSSNTASTGDVGSDVNVSNTVGDNHVTAGSSSGPCCITGLTPSSKKKDDEPKPPTTTTVRVSFDTNITNKVSSDSTIVNSGNAVVTPPSVTQSNSAPITQSTKGDDDKKGKDGKKSEGPSSKSKNDADVDQSNNSTSDNSASTGDVGSDVNITNDVGHNTVNCWGAPHSTVTCDVSFNTTISNTVDLRSIICGSGNAVIGTLPSFVCNLTPPAAAATAPAASVKPAANTTQNVSPVASAGTKAGQLAFTGAETSLPLTLGLLALGMGGALTLAGRRRQTTTV